MTVELGALLREQQAELKNVAAGLAEGNAEKLAAALGTLLLAVATGHPEIGILSPLIEQGVRRILVPPATRRLLKARAEAQSKEDDAARIARIVEPLEALIGQALIQLVRVQHHTNDEVIKALGGMRDDLAEFREEIDRGLISAGVRVKRQLISSGATGLEVSSGADAAVFIDEMTVTDPGSVGITLRGR